MNLIYRRRAGASLQNLGLTGGGADNSMPHWVQSGTGFPDGQAFGKCVPEFAFGMGHSFPLRCFAESASHSGRSKWDTLSQRRSNGKLRPIIRSRNGMHFPNESKTGKCIPQSVLKVGRRFPMRLKRKMHPGICAQSGMRFPVEGLRGKCVPESTLEMGCSFPMRHSTESTSQKWPLNWDKVFRHSCFSKMRHAVGGNETSGIGHRAYYSWK